VFFISLTKNQGHEVWRIREVHSKHTF